jgi:putative membrane protein
MMQQDNRGLLVVLAVLVLVLLVGPVLMGGMMGVGMMGPGMMGWGYTAPGGPAAGNTWVRGLGMGFGTLLMLVFWGALIVGGVLLVRAALGQGAGRVGPTSTDDPLTILRRRYAAGEIDQPTYERMKAELDDRASGPASRWARMGLRRCRADRHGLRSNAGPATIARATRRSRRSGHGPSPGGATGLTLEEVGRASSAPAAAGSTCTCRRSATSSR